MRFLNFARIPTHALQILFGAILCFLAYKTGIYFFGRIHIHETFGFHDWPIFIKQAIDFLATNNLYNRDPASYEPSAPVYKFPPLFASLLIFFIHAGMSENTLKQSAMIIYITSYFISVSIILLLTLNKKRLILIPITMIIAFTFEPFFDNFISAQMEIPILLLLSLSLLALAKKSNMLSGFFIGVATAIKIYPIYFLGYYWVEKKYRAIFGVFIGLLFSSFISLSMVGVGEHVFYVFHVLPTLLTEGISGRGENLSIEKLLLQWHISHQNAEWMGAAILLSPLMLLFYKRSTRDSLSDANFNTRTLVGFSLLIPAFLLGTKNSWWNYQILLVIPILIIVSYALNQKIVKLSYLLLITIVCMLIFWCNLGKVDSLIEFFTIVLETWPFLNTVLLKINLMRGIGTFIVFLTLLHLYYHYSHHRESAC